MSIITLYVAENILNNFKDQAYNYYKKHNRLDQFSYSQYFKLCLLNFEKYLIDKNIDLIEPEESYLDFYARKGNINTLDAVKYDRTNVKSLTLSIDTYHNLAYTLMHTYYINFLENYRNYSISFFFYDLLKAINEDGFVFEYYNIK